jgi:ABC-type transporter lipoprotein component MlaA
MFLVLMVLLSLANPEASNRFIINNVLGFAGGFDKFSYFSVPLIGSIDEEELKEIERDKK